MARYGRLAGVVLIALAFALDAHDARSALAQSWPPFVLVAGLLLVGLVAARDGLFEAGAGALVRLPGHPLVLLGACLALVAVVTATLNLDTSVVFLTPVLVGAARRRRLDATPFLYGSVFMANASSLFLPGSNLTNLLVLAHARVSGARFFVRMLPMSLCASLLTAVGLLVIHRRLLRGGGAPVRDERAPARDERAPVRDERAPARERSRRLRLGAGLWGAVAAAALILALSDAALPVLCVGLLALAWRVCHGELGWRDLGALGLPALVSLFGLAVALGTVARASGLPGQLLHSPGGTLTAVVAALASVLVNNLPAAVVLSAHARLPARALLLGLNVGPNLAVTGSLAVLLWWRAARASGASPSALAYSRQGLALAPIAIAGALVAGYVF